MQVILNFGHEMMTSMHKPVEWSNKQPTEAEFQIMFGRTRISGRKILGFIRSRATSIRRLVLQNSDGYWSGKTTLFEFDRHSTILLL